MGDKTEEAAGLLESKQEEPRKISTDSISSASTTSLVFEEIDDRRRLGEAANSTPKSWRRAPYDVVGSLTTSQQQGKPYEEKGEDIEAALYDNKKNRGCAKLAWIFGAIFVGAWALATIIFLGQHPAKYAPHNPDSPNVGSGKKISLPQVMHGEWRAQRHAISWIEGAGGEDGLLLQQGVAGKDYLVVEDVRGSNATEKRSEHVVTLMKSGTFTASGETHVPEKVWPSKNLKHVLIATNVERKWRHSFYAKYWIYHVDRQVAEPLDPTNTHDRIQLASWSPQNDAVVFTRDNNMFLRKLSSPTVVQITTDGNANLFYGVPDWVFEEEVFGGNSASWWADDGKYLAFLKTDESKVPTFPVQYFVKRPSGTKPAKGQENYPEVMDIKYPKAGAPNPIVSLKFYDVDKAEVFDVKTTDEFKDDNRLITEVVWAGSTGKCIVRETNRESDTLRVVLYDAVARSAKTTRTDNVSMIDGGWFEVSQKTTYIPADPANGRPNDGYIDTIIHEGWDHLAYFTPLDSSTPIHLTKGKWEVVTAPSAVDSKKNIVYFVATKESPIQRHIYQVNLLDGSDLKPVTDAKSEGYYSGTFSTGAGYILLSYEGPSIPWQKVITTPSAPHIYERVIETNPKLSEMAKKHDLPTNIYSTVTIDGFELQVVERRPPHFNPKKKYPVLFHLYGGPGSQTVENKFNVDFQAYVAAALGYVVVTVDGRGTGYIGRKARVIIRGNIGYYESIDQIETAKIWAGKKYVDAERMAIWGWSYGGFMTLKTLERDAGRTFKYGMAVAPVTDWRFYDSVYTERYMHTPQQNPSGYENSTISDVESLGKNVRFLMMHGVADDNVHFQNSLTLIDKLNLGGIENYDVHMFPDSDHSISFHNANTIVYDSE